MKALVAILSAALLAAGSWAGTTPTIDEMLSLRSASNPQISPNGRLVLYDLHKADWDDNAFESELWVVSTATHDAYRLTNSRGSSSDAQWSPDGHRIAFLSDRDGRKQIFLVPPRGGEAVKLTSVETGVNAIRWSPDGRRIAFTAADPETKELRERKEKYGDYEVVQQDYAMTHLWYIDAPPESHERAAQPHRITAGSFSVRDFAWSPDSRSLAFSAARTPDPVSFDTYDIYTVGIEARTVRQIVNTPGPDTDPVWSPDGEQIAYETANGERYSYYLNSHIAVVPSDGGAPRLLGSGFDEDPMLLAWSPGGIFFAALQHTAAGLFRLDPVSGDFTRVSPASDHAILGFSFTHDFRAAAFMDAAPDRMPEVAWSPVTPFEQTRLTNLTGQVSRYNLATRELVHWTSTDGTPIEGILIKPAGFDPAKKHPLLVVVHGGPAGVDRPGLYPDRYYPVEMFAAHGALVLKPNYRGSSGYGEKFRSLNVRNLGVGDSWDVLSGVDALIDRGIVDPDRVGVMGWSQGGYISAFLATSTTRFKAVSVGGGISDWTTYYVNTDIRPFTRQYLHATPWDDPEIYRKTSPITYVNEASTPTLIQHGENDRRVPIPNAYELYQALEDRGVPVRMVVYKGFGHGIDRPKQQRAVMQENYDWFRKWIWDAGVAPLTASGTAHSTASTPR